MYLNLRLILMILVCWILVVVGGSILYAINGYPDKWDDVVSGMSRKELLSICGPPDSWEWDVKGHYYIKSQPWGGWALNVRSKDGTVHETSVRILWGSDTWYPVKVDSSFFKALWLHHL